ncbi:LppU/SCO3897 family protein [Streptomyces parvulus]|uniref:LppU/SCO3897 family protein n=1 Tax=Streptomyces parvulus TaxID=146923 RepID=UPI0033EEC87D
MTTQPPPQGNPFAQGQPQAPQQPQGQNPYAQAPQGFPQQPGQPGIPPQGAPFGPVPPQPARRKPSFKTIKNIVIAVIVVGVAVGGYIASRDDATTAAVGDCMHRGSSNDSNPDLEVVDCGDAKAQYQVLAKIEGSYSALTAESKCSAEAKDFQYSYTESGSGSDFLLCLKDYKK